MYCTNIMFIFFGNKVYYIYTMPRPAEYTFNSRRVYISFNSDAAEVRSGWRLEYTTTSKNDVSSEFCI